MNNDDDSAAAIEADYLELIARLGRVQIRHRSAPLPVDLAARIAGRSQWLRRTVIPRLDQELSITFPFVLISPACWYSELADGTGGIAKGRVGPFATGERTAILAIELSAVVPLVYPDDLFEGVLAHEFLHYIWMTKTIAVNAVAGRTTMDLWAPLDSDMKEYRQRDGLRAADSETWLPPRLRQLKDRAEDSDGPEILAIHQQIKTLVEPGLLPVEVLDRRFSFSGRISLDPTVIERGLTGLERESSNEA